MSGDSPVNKDRAGPSFSTNTSAPLDLGIIGGVLNVGGDDEPLFGPVGLVGAVFGVPDIDAIVEGVVRGVVDKSWGWNRGLVFFIGLHWVFVVDLGVLIVVVLSHGQRATA